MIAGTGGQNPIPYGILFRGDKFILFRNANTLGEVRYGLTCSSIIDNTSTATPLIPLIIYTLMGKTNPATLHKSTFSIPPEFHSDITRLETDHWGQKQQVRFLDQSCMYIFESHGSLVSSFCRQR